MKKNEEKLDVVFVIDKSGSMAGSEKNTISSFNEYLEREANNNYKTNVTTLFFNETYEYLYKRCDIKKINKMKKSDYVVGGCTALYDALGNSISYMDECDTEKVIFIIITDGYENASRKYDSHLIKKLIKNHKDWEFIYIGADIDSYASGSTIGIKKDNIANFKKDAKGTSILFKSVSNFQDSMMSECECVGAAWKEDLDDYIKDNM